MVYPADKNMDSNSFSKDDAYNCIGIVRSIAFFSELRRMCIIMKANGNEIYWAFTKGVPKVIAQICSKIILPSSFQKVLRHYTYSGYIITACVGNILPKYV